MDELEWLRMLGGSFGSGFDLAALLAFVAFAVLYLLVPVIGYRADRRGGMLVALYFLVGYGSLSLLQLLVQWVLVLDGGGFGPGRFGPGEAGVHVLFAFAGLKMVAFLVAMVLFVSGLQSVRLREPKDDDWPFGDRPRRDTSGNL
jgi:hypothetical protein